MFVLYFEFYLSTNKESKGGCLQISLNNATKFSLCSFHD